MTGSKETEVNTRRATRNDASAISFILRELGWFSYINDEAPETTEARIEKHIGLCHADESHTVLVAENLKDEIVGYIAVHWLPYLMLMGPEGYVSELIVKECERGKEIGKKLLEAVKKQAIERGCARLMLGNGRSRQSYQTGFYKKLGWKERPEIANFILPLF